ncbi:MAG TPA: ABC transporter ATP-binding protein, partial [Actinomycetota bacterium]|nr:ABC transporter ATP-binding protein [Actinomycetota bacterium]
MPDAALPRAGSPAPPLRIEALTVTYQGGLQAVRGVDLTVEAGQRVGLVGESGCGKTSIVRACMGLLPKGAHAGGSISVGGTEVVGVPARITRRLRGLVVGYVPQSPAQAFDPVHRVAHHVEEAWHAQGERPAPDAVEQLLARLGLPEGRSRQYPHQWSGGMLQRATIAAATAHRPLLTIADEPTSALDADLADGVLEAVSSASCALLLVTHDLRLAARSVESIAVCYAGRVVEMGPAPSVVAQPRHP